jgi:hypothetical protein
MNADERRCTPVGLQSFGRGMTNGPDIDDRAADSSWAVAAFIGVYRRLLLVELG